MAMLPAQSQATPALGTFNRWLYVAWSADFELEIAGAPARGPGGQWGAGVPLDEWSYHGPALCPFKDRLYIAWTGTDEYARLNVMSSGGNGLEFDKSTKVVLSEQSQYGPALATDGEALYLTWVGVDPAHMLNVISSQDGITFRHEDKSILGGSATASPAVTINTLDNRLFMAWTAGRKILEGELLRKDGPGSAVAGWGPINATGLPGQETLYGPALATLEFRQSGTGLLRLAYSARIHRCS